MVLRGVKGFKNIFPHSREYNQGSGQIRKGSETVIVAQDGSGDTNSIQDGIDMLSSDGGVVYIKEGTYTLTSAIGITSNTTIIGAGAGATIIKHSFSDSSFNITSKFVYFSHIGFIAQNDAKCLVLSGAECYVDHCQFTGGSGGQAMIKATTQSTITNCYFATGGHGVLVNPAEKVIIKNCTFEGTTKGVSLAFGADKCIVIGNCFESCTIGIDMANTVSFDLSTGNILIGNVVLNCTTTGISIGQYNDKTVCVGNSCFDSGTDIDNSGTNTEIANNVTS